MVRKTVVELVDDLDGSRADETVEFGIDGSVYQIDLSADHAEDLRSVFEAYVRAGRKVTDRSRRRTRARSERTDTRAVREWARSRGIQVSERGRIPQHVLDAYHGRQTG
ncbi:Lsr2 family protein [Thermobifida halotolerans]|uniref:Lsr2 family protein n=1 Tax=Thermobifida halotolerans TaxID=483545 RepID=A0A399G771_9ACTN|nr:Lsr2 family protein [Thermobifida halotolerans]UOE21564.1 Lsr2 family protein [Thermobifida halotolerans]